MFVLKRTHQEALRAADSWAQVAEAVEQQRDRARADLRAAEIQFRNAQEEATRLRQELIAERNTSAELRGKVLALTQELGRPA